MKTNFRKMIPFALVGVISGATVFGGIKLAESGQSNSQDYSYFGAPKGDTAQFASLGAMNSSTDFTQAAKMTVPAVVTIKNYSNRTPGRSSEQDILEWFFKDFRSQSPQQQQRRPDNMPSGMGSGVIISPDGYIISNNHVVAGASKLEVVLSNKKSYTATLVGSDPNTDISLLKIEEKGLPYLNFANSDLVEVGQWVLAVGNPLGLNSTATAGIISAKGRGIGILSQGAATNPIESFLQTDAAINMGNSGGALVNTSGDLIGINSAIASTTGYYQGYGFAVPSNLARKIVEDIKKFGIVQRGFLGVSSIDLSDEQQLSLYNRQYKTSLKPGVGIYVREVSAKSGAEDAGLKTGDVIKKVDNLAITDFADLSIAVGSKRPGDAVNVTYTRNGKDNTVRVVLKDMKGNTSARTRADLSVSEKIGAEFEPLNEGFKTRYGLESGVLARNVVQGSEMAKIGIVDNYIIMEINGKPVNSQKDVDKILDNYKGNVQVKYVDEAGRMYTQGFKMP